jgi:hypothetical protein
MLGPKTKPVRSEAYRKLVASMPCVCCGIQGRSQAAHANSGRGLGQKAPDTELFPLCADSPGSLGCHSHFDRLIGMTLERRRELEREYIAKTHEKAIEASWSDWRVRALLERIGLVRS